MSGIPLNSDQEKLRDRVDELASTVKQRKDLDRLQSVYDDMAKAAHELHMSLKQTGHEPRHHRYMYENRGVPATNPEFYHHIHAVQDLLRFIDDPHANDDPVDGTMGQDFDLKVYSRRWGNPDNYRVHRTTRGWDVYHISIGGPCDKTGEPFLFANLRHDSIEYPSGLGEWLRWLWDQANERGLTHDEVQGALNEIGDWIESTERNSPSGGIWQGYK